MCTFGRPLHLNGLKGFYGARVIFHGISFYILAEHRIFIVSSVYHDRGELSLVEIKRFLFRSYLKHIFFAIHISSSSFFCLVLFLLVLFGECVYHVLDCVFQSPTEWAM